MTVTQAASLSSHAAFRSLQRPQPPTQKPNPGSGRHQDPWWPALRVVGHMAAATFVFMSFVTLVWLASWGFSYLHSVHALSDDAFQLFETLESVLIRIDAALSAVVLLRGLVQYILSNIRSDS